MARIAIYALMENYYKGSGLRAPAYHGDSKIGEEPVGRGSDVPGKALTADGYTVSPKSKVVTSS
eukprot:6611529-Heterocapsa_arctica.AAC.1